MHLDHVINAGGLSVERFDGALRSAIRRYGDGILVDHGRPCNAADFAFRADAAEIGGRVRADAFGGSGMAPARSLEYVHARVLEEKMPTPNGQALFSIDASIPLGARSHTVRRVSEYGEAVVYKAGEEVPRVGVSQAEEQFPVHYVAVGMSLDIFDRASSDFGNLGVAERMMRAARRAIERKINRLIWYGSKSANLYGVLTYPWLAKSVSGVAFDGTDTAAAMLAELHALAHWPADASLDVFAPEAVVTSPRVLRRLATTKRTTTTDETVLDAFLGDSTTIRAASGAWECQGVGPTTDYDAMLFFRRDADSIRTMLSTPFSLLPPERRGFEDLSYAFAQFGGVVMGDVGNAYLVWVKAA